MRTVCFTLAVLTMKSKNRNRNHSDVSSELLNFEKSKTVHVFTSKQGIKETKLKGNNTQNVTVLPLENFSNRCS